MQFVSVDSNGDYALNQQAREILQCMPGPTTIVSVIGRYRTGKSSLLNGLIGTNTFQTSSTVQAQTKGIMMHQLTPTTLLLDTEGLGSLDVTRDHDASIFALAMLVSSGCFFNNLGSITSQTVDDLHLATKVATLLCKHTKFNKQLPALVWVMRDFTLDICDRNGIPISADVYLEQCIDKCAADKASDIRSLFPSRRCIPLSRPTLEEVDLRAMTNLRVEFVEGIDHIRTIVRNFAPKCIGDNTSITGGQICTLIDALCGVLNSKALPNLDDVWTLVATQSKHDALTQAKSVFASASSTLDGLSDAYHLYQAQILDDCITGDETFALFQDLLKTDRRDSLFEEQYMETKRSLDILVASSEAQHKDAEARIRDHESTLASAHRKVARLVDEGLATQIRLKELESAPVSVTTDHSDLIEVLEGLQTKHKDLKKELTEKRRMLDDVVQTIHEQDRTIADHTNRLAAERQVLTEHRVKSTELESRVSDLKANVHQATTDVAIWRTRYEDMVSRVDKKRKMTDDTYTELISLTSEVNFLRNRHDDDAKRIQQYVHEHTILSQQVQSLQVKLALEIGK